MFDPTKPLQQSGLIEMFLAWAVTNLKPGTVYYYRLHLGRFCKAVESVPVAELKKRHVTTWEKKWHPLQAVKRLFQWAVEEAEVIDRNPFATVRLPHAGQRSRVVTRRECVRLLRESSRAFRDYLLALRESIARPQEIRSVAWEHIQPRLERTELLRMLPTGRCRFVQADYKSRERRTDPNEPRVIVINPRLGRLLVRLRRRVTDAAGVIFINDDGRPWTNNAVRLRMRWLRRRLKIDDVARGERIVAYTLRHTSATDAIAGGFPLKLVSVGMGHTNVRTTNRYLHPSLEQLISATLAYCAQKNRRACGGHGGLE